MLSIREEELSHLHHAEDHLGTRGIGGPRGSPRLISTITDVVIWLSTWGNSTRMARDLRAATHGGVTPCRP